MTRVLVIDDHPIVLQGCRQLLEDAGLKQIIQAQSLADGFRLYRAHKPDLIIVDLAMRTGALAGFRSSAGCACTIRARRFLSSPCIRIR
jgi:DNA-binding NarL/FixJ family response regulator